MIKHFIGLVILLFIFGCSSTSLREPSSQVPRLTAEIIKNEEIKWCYSYNITRQGPDFSRVTCDNGVRYNPISPSFSDILSSRKKRIIQDMEELGARKVLSSGKKVSGILFNFDGKRGGICAGYRGSSLGELRSDGDYSSIHAISLSCSNDETIEFDQSNHLNSRKLSRILEDKHRLKLLLRMNGGRNGLTYDIYTRMR